MGRIDSSHRYRVISHVQGAYQRQEVIKMTRFSFQLLTAAVLAIVVTAGAVHQKRVLAEDLILAEETCGDYGTSVTFVESTAEAAKQALKEEKLVFVLHVSGNFEASEFT